METRDSAERVLCFSVFEADLRAGELRRNGLKIKLHPQPFRLLAMLLERPGQVVTREQLREQLWPQESYLDFDRNLNKAMNRLRRALGDSAETPRFVETLARRGYRFIAPVEARSHAGLAGAAALPAPTTRDEERTPEPATPPVGPRASVFRRPLTLATAGALLLIAFPLVWILLHPKRPIPEPSGPARIQSLAVLPFENLTGDPSQDYLADGMTEALITALAQFGSARVISRTSVMVYKGRPKPVPEIAQQLKVDALVEGTFLRSGDQLRITAQLIDARTDRHLWAQRYDRPVSDILALQDELAAAIARECQLRLARQERRQPASTPADPRAYEAYLKGRFFWNKRTGEARAESVRYFQQAIEADPNYAAAYAGLADCYQLMALYGQLPTQDGYLRAKQAATKALALDDTLADAHTSLALMKKNFEWDWAGAEREYRRALQLNPSYAQAHHWYAEFLSAVGRKQEALAEIQQAAQLDPLSPVISVTVGQMYARVGQHERAVEQYRKTLEIEPLFYQANHALAALYMQLGKYDQAFAESRTFLPANPAAGSGDTFLASLHALSGNRREALRRIERMKKAGRNDHYIAEAYAALGDNDWAFEWLEKLYQRRDPYLAGIKANTILERLHSDPRYADLLQRMGLPP